MTMRLTGGMHKGRQLKTLPEGPGYRPAMARVREALFSMLQAKGVQWDTARVLDLFAGSGSLGFEALSRGAPVVWFMENNPGAVKLIAGNAVALDIEEYRYRVLAGDLLKELRRAPKASFNLAFIDPPYGKNVFLPTLHALLNRTRGDWLEPESLVVAETAIAMKLDPENIHPQLTLLTHRNYGQTRITIWQTIQSASPSTPAPSTP
jgi:16S rRNA (guanine966-N2)-methyltransferase